MGLTGTPRIALPLRIFRGTSVLVCSALGFLLQAAAQVPRCEDDRLELTRFAAEPSIVTPVALDIDALGRVWVIESNTHFPEPGYPGPAADRIWVIGQLGDGRAGKFRLFAEGFKHAMALEVRDERSIYLATRAELYLLEDRDGDGRHDLRKTLARLETKGDYPHNGLSGFAVDELGRLFFSMGENLGVDYRLVGDDGRAHAGGGEGGNIFRVEPDGTGLVHWATGFWNPFNLEFDALGNLFAVDNDPDSRPPCRLLHIMRGGDYGYRFEYGRKGLHPFTSWNGQIPGTLPMVAGTGEAPSGVVAYEHDAFPAEYRGTLLATSWGDHRIERFRLKRDGASFRSHAETIVQGDESFRPVDIDLAPDGSVFFTDWVDKSYHVHGKGRIWRLAARNPQPTPLPEGELGDSPSYADVEERLAHPARFQRERSVDALVDSASGDIAEIVERVARQSRSDRARYHALVVLARRRELSGELVDSLVRSPLSSEIQAAALRVFFASREAAAETRELASLSGATAAPQQLERLLHADRFPESMFALALANESDPFLRRAGIDRLARQETDLLRQHYARHDDPRLRLAALLALREREQTESLGRFLGDFDPAVRRAAIQWAGEARLARHREAVESALELRPLTREVFDAAIATLDLLAGRKPQDRDQLGRDGFLLDLTRDPDKPEALRVSALKLISPGFEGLELKVLRQLSRSNSSQLRREAVRRLREVGGEDARKLLESIATDGTAAPDTRREAVIGLSLFPQKGRDVLTTLLKDPDATLRKEAARSLRGGEGEGVAVETLVRERRESGEEWKKELVSGGDAREGEIVFFHPRGPRCFGCHTVDGRGGAAGPDLSTAGDMEPARIVQSILEPAREIAPHFTTWLVLTKQGPKTGIIMGEAPDGSILLGGADAKVEKLARGDIVSKTAQESSLMPDNIADTLTLTELRDLVAFLRSRAPPTGDRRRAY